MTTPTAVVASRLSAQWLTGRPGRDPTSVVRHLLAVQSQEYRGARLAVRARSVGLTAADVDVALDDKHLVVTWLNRGTLHLVAAEDLPWLRQLVAPRSLPTSDRMIAAAGVSAVDAARAGDLIAEATAAGPVGRDAIRARLDDAGVPTAGHALLHLIVRAALDGVIVRGPLVSGQPGFVATEAWLGPQPRWSRDEALGELARRYCAAHAPADPVDLARWAGITLGDARAAFAASGALGASDTAGGIPQPVLLGSFDPIWFGWQDRAPILSGHDRLISRNGIFRESLLVGGRAVGSWSRSPAGSVGLVPFEPLSTPQRRALERDAADVERFIGQPQAATGE